MKWRYLQHCCHSLGELWLKKGDPEKALVFATHFPIPGLGTIQRRDASWQWHPVTI
jgi:hypothetical protein